MQESYRILLTEDFLEQPSHVTTQYLHGLNALIILLDFPLFPPHVVQIHIDETPNQVLICLHCRCMIAVFAECTFSAFPIIVLLGSSASRQLQSLRDDFSAIPVMNQEMDVVGGCHVIENDNVIPLLGPKKPVEPTLTIPGKLSAGIPSCDNDVWCATHDRVCNAD